MHTFISVDTLAALDGNEKALR